MRPQRTPARVNIPNVPANHEGVTSVLPNWQEGKQRVKVKELS